MAFPWAPVALGALSLFGANRAAGDQRRATNRTNAIAREQLNLFRQASPYYAQILQFLSQQAGIPYQAPAAAPGQRNPFLPASIQPVGGRVPAAGTPPVPNLPQGSGALGDQALGIYASNPADRLRFAQAEEEIARATGQRQNQLSFLLDQRGVNQPAIAAALTRNEGQGQQQLAQFRRQLAIQAQQEQERRVGALLSALGIGVGAGPQAAGIYGQNAALAGNTLQGYGQGLGQLLQAYMTWEALRRNQGGADPTLGALGLGVTSGVLGGLGASGILPGFGGYSHASESR